MNALQTIYSHSAGSARNQTPLVARKGGVASAVSHSRCPAVGWNFPPSEFDHFFCDFRVGRLPLGTASFQAAYIFARAAGAAAGS